MDNTTKEWHINSGCKMNQDHMIKRNLAYIGLGSGNDEYTGRCESNGFTTPKQFEKFKKDAKKGDKIYLYQNGVGYIQYGYYTGIIYVTGPSSRALELAPDWRITEIQKHIQVDQWIPISNPTIPDIVIRFTLNEIK
jgi:hypothetical protein